MDTIKLKIVVLVGVLLFGVLNFPVYLVEAQHQLGIITVQSKGYILHRDDGSYYLYNQNSTVFVYIDHDELLNGLYPLTWTLQRLGTTDWINLTVSGRTLTVNSTAVTRTTTYTDGTTLTQGYKISDTKPIKFTEVVKAGRRDNFRIMLRATGLVDENSYLPVGVILDPDSYSFTFTAPSYLGNQTFIWDWSDTPSATLPMYNNGVMEQWFICGLLNKGATKIFDPTTVTTTAGQYATAYGNARHIVRDAYGKLIAVTTNTNLILSYSNDTGVSWKTENLGATYSLSATTSERTCSIAYNSTVDSLLVAWVANDDDLDIMRITFSRDGSNNISGRTLSSILTIPSVDDTVRRPSLWALHNGEIGAVWGDNSISGGKHGRVYSCRIVFGSPPTYKNWAGTASSTTLLSSDYTAQHTVHLASIIQRINSGTGQYDCCAFWVVTYTGVDKKAKATFSTPNWSWGAETTPTVDLGNVPITVDYESTNGLMLYGNNEITNGYIRIGSINASDTDSDISPTNIAATHMSICVVGSDIYVFYESGGNIYYIKRASGSWGSEVQVTTGGGNDYPSVSLATAGRIDFIWTYLVSGSDYDVYYSSLTLVNEYTKTITQGFNFGSSQVLRDVEFNRVQTQGLSFNATPSRLIEAVRSIPVGIIFGSSVIVEHFKEYLFTITQGLIFGATATRNVEVDRTSSVNILFETVNTRNIEAERTSVLTLILDALASRNVEAGRTSPVNLILTGLPSRQIEVERNPTVNISFDVSPSRLVEFTRISTAIIEFVTEVTYDWTHGGGPAEYLFTIVQGLVFGAVSTRNVEVTRTSIVNVQFDVSTVREWWGLIPPTPPVTVYIVESGQSYTMPIADPNGFNVVWLMVGFMVGFLVLLFIYVKRR